VGDFLKQWRDLAEVEGDNLAAFRAVTFPTMRGFRWEDPEMMLLEGGRAGFAQQSTALASEYGEEFPIVPLVNVHRVHPEVPDAGNHVTQHGFNSAANGRICKASDRHAGSTRGGI
jgi:hypothetical protein